MCAKVNLSIKPTNRIYLSCSIPHARNTQGSDIQDCVRFIDGVVKGAGPDAISAILGQKYVGKKWNGIVQLADSLNIPVPDVVTRVEKARKKIQAKFQDHAKLLEKNVPVESLVLKPDFLQLNAVQIPRVAGNSCSSCPEHSFPSWS